MTEPTISTLHQQVTQALERVIDPCSAAHGRPLSLAQMGLIRDLKVDAGVVTLHLYLTSPICTMVAKIIDMAEQELRPIPGIHQITVIPDSGLDWPGPSERP